VSTEQTPLSPDSDGVVGVQRLNRLPLAMVTGLCVIILAVLVYAGFQRANQNSNASGLGGKLEGRLDPVAPEQATRELFHEYQEEPPIRDGLADLTELYPIDQPEPGLSFAPSPDRFSEEEGRLAHDASMAPTVVPTDDLYQTAGISLATHGEGQAMEEPVAPHPGIPLPGDTADPNLRKRKDLFKQTQRHYGYSSEPRRPAISRFIVRVGSLIPAVLVGGINSDLPGEVLAQVSHDVRDSRSGRHVLIPRGSKLIGLYDHHIAMGQRRVMTVWHRIQLPDDSTLDLGGMPGVDQAGYAGFRDRVNNHYGRIFGSATFLALVGAGVQMAIPRSKDDNDDTEDPAETLKVETARQWGEVGREMVRRNLRIQPTLEIRPGYKFSVIVDKDLILPPYAG